MITYEKTDVKNMCNSALQLLSDMLADLSSMGKSDEKLLEISSKLNKINKKNLQAFTEDDVTEVFAELANVWWSLWD